MDTADPLSRYVDELLKEKFGTDVGQDDLENMKQELLSNLRRWIILKILTELAKTSKSSVADFQNFVQAGNPTPEQIQAYIKEKIPDGTSMLSQSLLEFKATYLGTP